MLRPVPPPTAELTPPRLRVRVMRSDEAAGFTPMGVVPLPPVCETGAVVGARAGVWTAVGLALAAAASTAEGAGELGVRPRPFLMEFPTLSAPPPDELPPELHIR